MDRFENIEKKKIRPIKNTWYNCLINYIPEPIKKCKCFKKKIASPYKSITLEQTVPEQTVYERGKKRSKTKKRIIKKPFVSEKNREEIKD